MKMHPMALSTPKSKLDHMGDRLADDSIANKSHCDPNMSAYFQGALEHIPTDHNAFREFRKCVMLFWLGYKVG